LNTIENRCSVGVVKSESRRLTGTDIESAPVNIAAIAVNSDIAVSDIGNIDAGRITIDCPKRR